MNEQLRQIIAYVFQTLLFIFLLTLLLKEFYPKTINAYININWFMLVVIIVGALSIFFPPKDNHIIASRPTKKDYFLLIVLSILGFAILAIKLASLGWIGWLISLIGALIIGLISYLIINEEDKPQDNLHKEED